MIQSTRRNGEILIESLELMGEPATFTELLRNISMRWKYEPNEIRRIVRNTLRKGVRNGFIVKIGRSRYTTTAIILNKKIRNEEENIKTMYHNYLI